MVLQNTIANVGTWVWAHFPNLFNSINFPANSFKPPTNSTSDQFVLENRGAGNLIAKPANISNLAKLWEKNLISQYFNALDSFAKNNGWRAEITERGRMFDGRTNVHFQISAGKKEEDLVLEMIRVIDGESKQIDMTYIEVGKNFRKRGITTEVFAVIEPKILRDNDVVYVRAAIENPLVKVAFERLYETSGWPHDVGWPNGIQKGVIPRTDSIGIKAIDQPLMYDPLRDLMY